MRRWVLLAMLALPACSGAGAEDDEEGALSIDAEDKDDSLRPPMKLGDAKLVGVYKPMYSDQYCSDGGRGLCDQPVEIRMAGGEAKLFIGYQGAYEATLAQTGSVVSFSETFYEECDDPGCSNVTRLHGIVYYRKLSGRWRPTVRLTTVVDYPYPESEDDPSGEVSSRAYLVKRR